MEDSVWNDWYELIKKKSEKIHMEMFNKVLCI